MSEQPKPKCVVIVNDSHTPQASLGERNYSDRHYTAIATGKYEDIESIAKKLNAESVAIKSEAVKTVNVDAHLATMTPEQAAAGVAEYVNRRAVLET